MGAILSLRLSGTRTVGERKRITILAFLGFAWIFLRLCFRGNEWAYPFAKSVEGFALVCGAGFVFFTSLGIAECIGEIFCDSFHFLLDRAFRENCLEDFSLRLLH